MNVLVVALSPAVDQVMVLNAIPEEGKIYRAIRKYRSPGSKSLNVARFLSALGHQVTVVGFFGPFMGRWLVHECERQGIRVLEAATGQDNRISVILLKNGSEEVVSDLPMEVTQEEYLALRQAMYCALKDKTHVLFSGSVAHGVSASHFDELIQMARAEGLPVVADVRGEFLQVAARHAWLLKVNQHEAQALPEIPRGTNVGITCEGMGAVFRTSEDILYRVRVPQLEAVNTVGAGDVFLSYLLSHFWKANSWKEALRVAAAAATSSITTEEIGKLNEQVFKDLLKWVTVSEEGSCGQGTNFADGWFC